MSGIGSRYPTYEPLRQAIEAHAREIYGDSYVLADFVTIAYVVDMGEDESEQAEYIMATSSGANHIIEGLTAQVHLFSHDEPEEGDN